MPNLDQLRAEDDITSKTDQAETTGSYNQILKSSALIGGSSLINILVGILRTKVMALLLGPAGIGLIGVYGSVQNLVQTLAGMGINSSGVRQIAEAAASQEKERIAKTAAVLRRTSIVLGALGTVLLAAFAPVISKLSFGNSEHAAMIAILSVAVFFGLVSGAQGALVQGMRRIRDMAKMSILGTVFGAIISILLVCWLRENGIVPSLVAIAAMSILTSWWYSRKIQVPKVPVGALEVRREVAELLKLGLAFMASSFLTLAAGYAVRVIVLRQAGLNAAGLYQSAWTLGGTYVGFILGAMGADFYPRLTAIAKDNTECNRLVNEQAEVGLLLAAPGILGTITFCSLVVTLLYSTKFSAAVSVLRWFCLGTMMQVITWPLGFILLAKGAARLFLIVDGLWVMVNVGLSWFCVKLFGLPGAGVAFFAAYLIHLMVLYPIVRKLTGFRWSRANMQMGFIFMPILGLVFGGFYSCDFWIASVIGVLATLTTGIYSIGRLLSLSGSSRVPTRIRRWLVRTRLAPPSIIQD
jgi:antigen flippase